MTTTVADPTSIPEYTSVGRVCAALQRDPRAVQRAAKCAGVKPSLVLNGVVHYSPEAVATIAQWFREQAAE